MTVYYKYMYTCTVFILCVCVSRWGGGGIRGKVNLAGIGGLGGWVATKKLGLKDRKF